MKKISLLVLLCMILSLVFASCDMINKGSDTESTHEHEYGKTWSFDAANHYHACTCGSQSDVAAHADDNNDGACDTCAIILDNTHVFDSAWTTDAVNHWHAALCGHDVVDAKAAHTANELGYCSVCGVKVTAPVIENIADALEISELAAYLVNYGYVESATNIYGEESYVYSNFVWYEFAENYLHTYDSSEGTNTYVSLDGEDVLSITVSGDGYVWVSEDATLDNLNGPAFGATFFGDYETKYYGVNELVAALYALGLENANGDFAETAEDGVYGFSYLHGVYDADYAEHSLYSVGVSFTINPNTYYLENVNVYIEKYAEITSVYSYEVWDYVDFTNFTYTTEGENTVYTLNFGAEASVSYEYSISQTADVEPKYTPDEVLLLSYSLVDAEGEAVDFENGVELSLANASYVICLDDITPTTALLDMVNINVVFTDAEGTEVYSAYASCYDGEISMNFYKPGSYVATITINNDTYTLPVTVSYETPTYIGAAEYKESNYQFVDIESKSLYLGNSFVLSSSVAYGCDPGFVAELVGDNAASATLTLTEADGKPAYEFATETVGVYTVKLTSTADSTVTCELVVTVEEKVFQVSTLIKGTYKYVEGPVDITVVFDTENSTVTASTVHPMTGMALSDTFNYTVENNVFTAELVQGGSGYFNAIYVEGENLVLEADYFPYTLTPAAEAVTGASSYYDEVPELAQETKTYTTTITEEGYAYFCVAYQDVDYEVTVTFEGTDVYLYYGNPMFGGNMLPSGQYFTLDMNAWNVLFWFAGEAGTEVTFTLTFTAI